MNAPPTRRFQERRPRVPVLRRPDGSVLHPFDLAAEWEQLMEAERGGEQ